MRRLRLLLFFCIFLINSAYALDYDSMVEGQKLSSIDIELSFDSELKLPTEGDHVKFNFILTPYLERIETNEGFFILFFLNSPENEYYRIGTSFFPNGPYEKGEFYSTFINYSYSFDSPGTFTNYSFNSPGTFTNYSFDSPGVWTLNYFVINDDSFRNNTLQEIIDNAPFRKKRIHVLSYYEANSMMISNNSYKVSILGIIGTIFAFLLGTFLNILIDDRKFSPKLKVNCSHGFVMEDSVGGKLMRTFTIEAINYGRTAVTLSSVGLNFNKKNIFLSFLSFSRYNAFMKYLEKIGFIKSYEEIKLLILRSEIAPLEFPKELLPGRSYGVIKDYDLLIKSLEEKIPQRAYFIDETGKRYYSRNIEKMFQKKK